MAVYRDTSIDTGSMQHTVFYSYYSYYETPQLTYNNISPLH